MDTQQAIVDEQWTIIQYLLLCKNFLHLSQYPDFPFNKEISPSPSSQICVWASDLLENEQGAFFLFIFIFTCFRAYYVKHVAFGALQSLASYVPISSYHYRILLAFYPFIYPAC